MIKFDLHIHSLASKYKEAKNIVDNSVSGFKSLLSWISKNNISNPLVCMEATGCYFYDAAAFFYEQGLSISIVNPTQIKKFRDIHEKPLAFLCTL